MFLGRLHMHFLHKIKMKMFNTIFDGNDKHRIFRKVYREMDLEMSKIHDLNMHTTIYIWDYYAIIPTVRETTFLTK